MSRRADELNTTSFAMLGMLAIRPWSTYELAKHMDHSLRRLWPRARSHLFNEPKKLVAHGLAVASEEMVGRRPRTIYTITPAGRRVSAELNELERTTALRTLPNGMLRTQHRKYPALHARQSPF